jgi:DHA1 family multidrug resistance protein-like MFS transporter
MGLAMAGCYTIMQSIFMYLTSTYPEYPASLVAANDFVSSYSAVGCSASSGPTFRSLGVVKGWNLLAGLDCGYITFFYPLHSCAANMWKRSILAAKLGVNLGKEESLENRGRLAGIVGV